MSILDFGRHNSDRNFVRQKRFGPSSMTFVQMLKRFFNIMFMSSEIGQNKLNINIKRYGYPVKIKNFKKDVDSI